jgi:hypothetical protein
VTAALCECGCGRRTSIATATDARHGYVKGEPRRFVNGHKPPPSDQPEFGVNRNDGRCECGCGESAPIATVSNRHLGRIRGKPIRFVNGHQMRGRIMKPERYRAEDRGYTTPCWMWLLKTNADGYGRVRVDGVTRPAHCVYYEQAHGSIPPGYQVDHLCRQPGCVNPDHLEAVTPTENVRRQRNVKLDVSSVRALRAAFGNGESQAFLARRFGVHPSLVSLVVRRKRWAEV